MTGDEGPAVDVSAVVVNWNTVDLLDACLRSLRDHPAPGRSMEVVVVDNGSTDGSAEMVRRDWPDAVLLANARNEGYTRANNQALRVTAGRHVLLINADAQLQPGCLARMVDRLETDPAAAVVGPRLVYGDGRFQRWTAGRAPGLGSAARYLLFVDRAPWSGPTRSLFLARDVRSPFCPDWVSSACMLVRRAALDEVGLLDERYFCYMDDVDLCQRVRDAGWKVWYDPAAASVHLMGQSTKRVTGASSPAALRNFNHYFAAHHGRWAGTAARALQVAGFGARSALYGGAFVARRSPGDRAAAVAHLRNLRRCLTGGHV